MPFNEFHYSPTGTGVISGKEVLEQTEDAINDLGTQISGDVQTAIDTANNALNTANAASADAQNAVNTANTAYTTATNAQNTANTAQNTASNALTAAQNAQNDVNALGNRVTTAENNISQNTTDISGLTTRMGTAEGNITNLQNDVVTAQGTATSAQNTATMARQQAYVLRYSSTAITDNSTIAYSTLDNTDNIKATDKIIDVDGKIFSVVSVDSDNSTVTVGSALIDLALDANVMHLSGNETVAGQKTFSENLTIYNSDSTKNTPSLILRTSKVSLGSTSDGTDIFGLGFKDKNYGSIASIDCIKRSTGGTSEYHTINTTDSTNNALSESYSFNLGKDGTCTFRPETNNKVILGTSSYKWKDVNTYLVNGLTPSSLSMPASSGTIDISGYITDLTGVNVNNYTPVANGYIVITCNSSDVEYIKMSNNLDFVSVVDNTNNQFTSGLLGVWQPCVAGIGVQVRIKSNALNSARFIPCQGNI